MSMLCTNAAKMSKNGSQTEDDAVLYSYPSLPPQIHSNHPAVCLLFYLSQDLKPSNVAVNEDCELRVRMTFSLNVQNDL